MATIAENFAATTEAAAKAQSVTNCTIVVADWNANLKAKYVEDHAAWLAAVSANTTKEQPPAVPMSYKVNVVLGWATPLVTDIPVCDPLPLPPDVVQHLSSTAKVGIKIPFTPFWQALDTLPQTDTAVASVSADGVSGWWHKVVQFGNLGHYEKVG
jgi:hypothetical protein